VFTARTTQINGNIAYQGNIGGVASHQTSHSCIDGWRDERQPLQAAVDGEKMKGRKKKEIQLKSPCACRLFISICSQRIYFFPELGRLQRNEIISSGACSIKIKL